MATNEDLELYYKSILIELELWHKTFIAEKKISNIDYLMSLSNCIKNIINFKKGLNDNKPKMQKLWIRNRIS